MTNRRRTIVLLTAVCISAASGTAQAPRTPSPAVRAFIAVESPLVAITHVRVLDGTGSPAREDQTVVISGDRIAALGDSASTAVPPGALVLDKPGYTVIPGLVGMHDHLIYPAAPGHYNTLVHSAPKLYLACGVTTIRTTGSLEPYAELSLKRAIDEGRVPGPALRVTSPFLEGRGAFTLQMHELSGPEEARRMVEYWAEQGVDDFKAYTNISRAELAAAVAEVHRRGLKITGHLCSLGFREAAALGIDNLEHGLLADAEFAPGKAPDVCPASQDARKAVLKLDIAGPEVQGLIRELVARGTAVTSTLPVFEISVPGRPPLQNRVLEALAPEARLTYLTQRARVGEAKDSPWSALLRKEMDFEREFVRAGGLLLAGPDPTGYGGVLPGFGDQREVELLVEAGFTPAEAVRIATHNGALYLGISDRVGTLAVGKQADLVLIKGDPTSDIAELRNVETVFKAGLGYDPARLIEAVRGRVGIH